MSSIRPISVIFLWFSLPFNFIRGSFPPFVGTRILHDVFIYIPVAVLAQGFLQRFLRLDRSKGYSENSAFLGSTTIMSASIQDCSLQYQPFICAHGKDHCPKTPSRRNQLKEWLFAAAKDGCRPCVQHCIEVRCVDANAESDNMHYTVMDWAQWAVDKKVDGAPEVVYYLISSCGYDPPIDDVQELPPLPPLDNKAHSEGSTPLKKHKKAMEAQAMEARAMEAWKCRPFICADGKDHCPKTPLRRKLLKEWLFSTANKGCRPCVQHCIDVLQVDAKVQSNNMHYTVMDWAQWAAGKKVDGAQEVVNYLTSSCGYDLPSAEPSSSASSSEESTPIKNHEEVMDAAAKLATPDPSAKRRRSD